MCGICGWIDKKSVDENILRLMTFELRHRGPDAQQVKVLNNVGLGHARLSIIDLSENGNQPMHNEDKNLWLVYNGEFYTFDSFRQDLQDKGHQFVSNTDSEVLLHLYEEDGPEFVHKLRGMYAFGLWDSRKKQLMLGRDRVGIKPLYYYHKGNTFLFASELKALLKHPLVSKELSPEAISYYFTLGYIPRHHCIFQSVKKLPPAHYLLFKNGEVIIQKYWTLPERNEDLFKTEQEYAEVLLATLEESVKIRLISDVPLGVFLSGGVDSSVVTALMARNSSKPVKTFSIGFESAQFDERKYARQVAHHFGSEHHEFVVSLDHTEVIDKLIYYYDEPFADSSAIPTYYVSKMAREHVIVTLSGDGGDELFGGYNWYTWVLRRLNLHCIPFFLRQLTSALSSIPPFGYKGKTLLTDLSLDEFSLFQKRTTFFSNPAIHTILNSAIMSPLSSYKDFYETQGHSSIDRMTRTDFNYYLVDDILTKVDRASMAVSLEARVPMLDHHLCEHAFLLPDHLRIRNGVKKYILKQIARTILPQDFPLERKQGFTIPLPAWMRGKLGDQVLQATENSSAKKIINTQYIKKLLDDHRSNYINNSAQLWTVLIFSLWCARYIDQTS